MRGIKRLIIISLSVLSFVITSPISALSADIKNAVVEANGISVNYAIRLQTNGDSVIAPFADNIVWYIKVENEKTYKRAFNHSTGQWVSDWILIP